MEKNIARLISQYPTLDIQTIQTALEQSDNNPEHAQTLLSQLIPHPKEPNPRNKPRPTNSARSRRADGKEIHFSQAGGGSSDNYEEEIDKEIIGMNRPLTSRTKKQIEDDEALAKVLTAEDDQVLAERMQNDYNSGLNTRPATASPSKPTKPEIFLPQNPHSNSSSSVNSLSGSRMNFFASSTNMMDNEPASSLNASPVNQMSTDKAIKNSLKQEELQRLQGVGHSDDDEEEEDGFEQHAETVRVAKHGTSPTRAPMGRLNTRMSDRSRSSSPTHLDTDDDYSISGSEDTANLETQLKELYQHISAFQPEGIDLFPELKGFIPEYIPAIGDIDPMIKIPAPKKFPKGQQSTPPLELPSLGFVVLDEPSAKQSDPAVLDLQIRAASKGLSSTAASNAQVRSINLSKSGEKSLSQWVHSVQDLHTHKPPDKVDYSKRMPDIESVMEEWPPVFDDALTRNLIKLPSASIDLSLQEYVRTCCSILDIPVYLTRVGDDKDGKGHRYGGRSHGHIESMHVLFSVYAEFKNSLHFRTK